MKKERVKVVYSLHALSYFFVLKEKLNVAVVEMTKDVVFERKLHTFWDYYARTCEFGVGDTDT